jgi:hypothetical protein
MFNDLADRSFHEIPNSTKLVFKNMQVLGYASPYTFIMYINIDRINEHHWPREAVTGLLAHELGHMTSCKRRSFIGRMLFMWNYRYSPEKKRKVEHEADFIAIEHGYGKELVLTRTLALRDYDDERVERMKNIYYWPDELEQLVSEQQ